MGEPTQPMTAEHRRLEESRRRQRHWKRWGPYVSERAWGTVREDYSPDGTAWEYLPHEQARSRAYRWGEDGLAGVCDNHQRLCFGLALWNGQDAILKERLFGLSGPEGNHGEDVKECYFYLDCTPTHSWMKFLYKYPQRAFPYDELLDTNRSRGRAAPEYELIDTGVFDDGRYFDVFVEYGKADVEDLGIRIAAWNRGPTEAPLHLLPTLWFRNTWAFDPAAPRPRLEEVSLLDGSLAIDIHHPTLGSSVLLAEDRVELSGEGATGSAIAGRPQILFTENETNREKLWGEPNPTPYVKDGIGRCLVDGEMAAVNLGQTGTKACICYAVKVPAGGCATVRLRLMPEAPAESPLGARLDAVLDLRQREADEFYATVAGSGLSPDAAAVQRQALAGLLWSKQFYHYDISRWYAEGREAGPAVARTLRRNAGWTHLYNEDVISMPDKWEYPWYAAWDLAFHCIPLALVDVDFAKEQLLLFLREWYMHPNGQIPAYEWAFGDVNPPVHAWAVWRVYKIEKRLRGQPDHEFLERAFHKLLLNFTWWVNRKDASGRNIFQGGFLGLDNIGVFDRSAPLPTGGTIEQSDATSWMGMYCLNMLGIAMELATTNPAYSDIASKFLEHFVYIANALNHVGGENLRLWDEGDGFFYDALCLPDGSHTLLKVRSMVGLIALFAVETLDPEVVDSLPGFKRRMQWFVDHRPHLREHVTSRGRADVPGGRLLAIVGRERLRRVLRVMLDEGEFLSPYGIRALSRRHAENPYVFRADGTEYRVEYEPGESASGMFGGNSNWRGPVWLPVNFLIIESLQKYHRFLGDTYKVECPTGSGRMMTLWEVATELSQRLCRIFLRGESDRRPVYGPRDLFQADPHWRDLVLFHEYFHGDSGIGLGASHQTGWTALVAKLLQQSGVGL
ncbi:MAG: glucosidase [Gemmatimonadota bacterium]